MKTNPFSHRTGLVLAMALFYGASLSNLRAVGLQSATVTEVKNEVNLEKEGVNARPAVKEDKVQGKDRLRTGKKSRAELEFQDRSIARLGSNTIFSFNSATRDMRVEQGTALIHVPPGLSGAKISTPAATAAIQGDVIAMRVNDQGISQFVALSQDSKGPVKVTFNKTGESRNLFAGQMLTLDPMMAKMPEPVNVAVDVFVHSSNMASGFKKELPASAQKEIKQTETLQIHELKTGALESRLAVTAPKNDVQALVNNNTTQSQIITQTVTGSSFGGIYTGTATTTMGGSGSGTLVLTFFTDGRLTSMYTNSNGSIDNGSGTWSTGGNFSLTQQNGKIITGMAQLGSSNISGAWSQPASGAQSASSGTFSVHK